ncbi:MAG: sortase [Sphingomonadales bacterium]|nr:sortase [Sphingomonadales bacterium]
MSRAREKGIGTGTPPPAAPPLPRRKGDSYGNCPQSEVRMSFAHPRGKGTVTVTVPNFLLRLPFLLLIAAGLALAAQGAWIPAKAWAAQVLLDRAFTRGLAQREPVKAWPWADAAPVARISVPRLAVSEIVLSGGSGEALAFGPTHLPASAAIGGRGTAVFAAHRDTHFLFLAQVRPGDEVRVETVDGRAYRYRVAGARVVRRDSYAPSGDLALVTCWPFGATEHGPLRYVVTARRLS